MDHDRFDRVARTMAGAGSRRGLLRGLAVAVGTLSAVRLGGASVAAGGQTVPLGGACIRSHQCIQYLVSTPGPGYDPGAQAVACDFNGFAYDGEFNCCRYRGGFCSVENDCCGYLRCFGGRCNS